MSDPAILDQAMDWHVRMLGQADAADFEAFCAWLEASPAHVAAYEEIATLDAEIEAPLRSMRPGEDVAPVSANDNEQVWRGRRRLVGWLAGATSIAAALALVILRPGDPGLTIETRPGQSRVTTLADGSEIHINGASKLTLSGHDHRTVALLAGEATFTVHHDDAHPFAVMVGDHELRDVGTRFNVRRDGPDFVLEVAEGRVAFDPSGEAAEVGAGEALAFHGGAVRQFAVSPDQVGSWQQRRLSYDAAPVRQIAEDLTRMLGVPVTAAPEVAAQRSTGTIVVPADRTAAIQTITLTLGLRVRPNNGGFILTR